MRSIASTRGKSPPRAIAWAAGAAAALAGLSVAIAQSPYEQVTQPTSSPVVTPAATHSGGAPASPGVDAGATRALPDAATMAAAAAAAKGAGDDKKDKPDFPPFEEVSKDFSKIVSTADGAASLYTLYKRDKDSQLLAELPKEFERQRLFIATTIAGGEATAGIQFGDNYAYWKRNDKRLMLVEPNLRVRSSGDFESQKSRENLFTDRVILDVPIACMGPGGGPVIDLDELLVGQAGKFFGPMTREANTKLATIATAKAFPQNVEIAFRMPLRDGVLRTFHYSISVLPENTGYQPRVADPRLGYFTTTYEELGKPGADEPWTRYINRWHLEKADPSLSMSPPKQPIIFYIEHTTPVRYRRWVRDGILDWNKAFEKVGFVNAVEVYQQDARSGAHMDKDPEDVRYNFFRWNSNGVGFAIGPSRVDPRTGQILDADIVLNDGFIRTYARRYQELIPQMAVEGFSPETLAWLDTRPEYDPRMLLAPAADRQRLMRERLERLAMGGGAMGGHPAAAAIAASTEDLQSHASPLLGSGPYDGLSGRVSQVNGGCAHANFKAMDVALMRLGINLLDSMAMADPPAPAPGAGDAPKPEGDKGEKDKDKDKKDKPNEIDGVPEAYIGPVIKEVVCHEVGHTLGLRHNFKASTIYTIQEINTEAFKGKAQVGSVMDYNPLNINFKDGPVQTDWVTPDIGPYDYWVIEYGYTSEKDLKPILAKCTDKLLPYATDEDTWGPDPTARRFDYGKDPLDWADSRIRLVEHLRSRIIDKAVKDGDGWKKAREAYFIILGQQTTAVSTAALWVGGSRLNRDRKGDVDPETKKGRDPIENIPVATQRRALKFIIDNALRDEAYGLTPELLAKMSMDKWWDEGGQDFIFDDETWDVHDSVAALQASALTMVMNPTKLRRIYDNELRVPSTEDTLTLAEVLFTVTDAAWAEIDSTKGGKFTARQPMISSLRRNLQREQLRRLIDLTMPGSFFGAAENPVATLATFKLRELKGKISDVIGKSGQGSLDPYTLAHLAEAETRIGKALEAQYIYNTDKIGAGAMGGMMFMQPAGK